MSLPNYETTQAVIAFVNQARAQRGLPPVQSLLKSINDSVPFLFKCPIRRTVEFGSNFSYVAGISVGYWFDVKSFSEIKYPPIVRQFILDFDQNKYLELKG